jgi:hypothetical protein
MGQEQDPWEIISVTAPSVPCWAVFASEVGNDDAPEADEFWTEPVHLWAHTLTALPADEADNQISAGHSSIVGMVVEEAHLIRVTDSQFVFLGYCNEASPKLD